MGFECLADICLTQLEVGTQGVIRIYFCRFYPVLVASAVSGQCNSILARNTSKAKLCLGVKKLSA